MLETSRTWREILRFLRSSGTNRSVPLGNHSLHRTGQKNQLAVFMQWRYLLAFFVLSLIVGGIVNYGGIHGWDDTYRYHHSQWLLHKFHLKEYLGGGYAHLRSYTAVPLELIFGLMTESVLPFLYDPYWIRHVLTFTLFSSTLYVVFLVLLRSGYALPTVLLAIAGLMNVIRLGGHALWNVKDAPYASIYLLVTVLLWSGLLTLQQDLYRKREPSYGVLVGLGIASVMPFLFRRPDMSHAVFLPVACTFLFLSHAHMWRWRTLALIATPILAAVLTLMLLWPPFLERGPLSIVGDVRGFSNFPWGGDVRLFGQTFFSQRLPWWYAFAWVPVIITPVGLFTWLTGMGMAICARTQRSTDTVVFVVRKFQWMWTLETWLWLHVFTVWFAVLLIQPTLYDEERHLLFIFPPLFLLGFLQLRRLSANAQYSIALVLLVTALTSYIHWGKYSYIYKSPLIPNRSSTEFMGDYKKICYAEGIDALIRIAPTGSKIAIEHWTVDLARIQYDRLRNSVLMRHTQADLPELSFVQWRPNQKPFYALAANRIGSEFGHVQRDIRNKKATLVWSKRLPTGEDGCIIAYFAE